MAEPLRPAPAKLYGRSNWIFISSIASATLAPTVAEVTATSSLDITNMLINGSEPKPEQNTNLVDQNRRYGDTVNYQFLGATTLSGGELMFQFNQQGVALADTVKAWEKFGAGNVVGFFANRGNVVKDVTPVAGQFLDVYPIEVGPGLPVPSGDGEAIEGAFKCSYAITSKPAFKVAILV